MRNGDLLVIGSEVVHSILAGCEDEIVSLIELAYREHGRGNSSLPHSVFLRFPHDPSSRIIGLPAYLGGEIQSAGIKWISSFPANVTNHELDRASAAIILNSSLTGTPKAFLEGSIISAKRTAASAALAAKVLSRKETSVLGIVGCGVINREIARFVVSVCPLIGRLVVFDRNRSHAELYKEQIEAELPVQVEVVPDLKDVLRSTTLVSFATTAGVPYVHDLEDCPDETVILNISLRDFAPEVILAHTNVVDDVSHVCRERTSIHLAEQKAGNRDFIAATLPDLLWQRTNLEAPGSGITIFSPFGLGILDIALAEHVFNASESLGLGTQITSFLPQSWKRDRPTLANAAPQCDLNE